VTSADGISARYFDGASSRPHAVQITVDRGVATIIGDGIERHVALDRLRVSEPLASVPRMITLPDQSFCEVADQPALAALLAATGYRDSLLVRVQRHWRGVAAAAALLLALLYIAYRWVIPWGAEQVALRIPLEWEARVGREAIKVLESRIFTSTALPTDQQARLARRFAAIAPHDGRAYEVRFRASKIGPNAFAAPGGIIYVSDALVQLADDDDAVLGVLAHELGHVEHRHLMRRVAASAAVGALATLVIGDVSTLLAAVPATLVDLEYSRDMEREADDYAIALLRSHGIPTAPTAALLERMSKRAPEPEAQGWPGYLSTHPPTPERVELFRGG
jgi:Zn-dependent protease with chaperone function